MLTTISNDSILDNLKKRYQNDLIYVGLLHPLSISGHFVSLICSDVHRPCADLRESLQGDQQLVHRKDIEGLPREVPLRASAPCVLSRRRDVQVSLFRLLVVVSEYRNGYILRAMLSEGEPQCVIIR